MHILRRLDIRVWGALALGFLAGTAGEGLLFTWAQSREIQETLSTDFRLLAFVPGDVAPERRDVIRELLEGDPDVVEARFVSKDQALAALGERDPELARSAAVLGRNPLPSAFELRLTVEGLGRLGDLARVAEKIPEISRIEYKSQQARAILEAQAYRKFVAVVLSLCLWVLALGAAYLVIPGLAAPEEVLRWLRDAAPAMAWGVIGAALGMGAVLALSIPIRPNASFWAWPPLWGQAAVAAAGALCGWMLDRVLP